jgi:hypothetical protein
VNPLKNIPTETEPRDQLAMLTHLGFGPETVLMNDPKLFVDGRFLAALLVEFQDELGSQQSSLALFQIGLFHGLRDAARVCKEDDSHPGITNHPGADTTSLIMHWTGGAQTDPAGDFSIKGTWPERHEAIARCSRIGASADASCWMSAGYTTGWLSGTFDRSLIAREVECSARGDETCRFEVQEASEWSRQGHSDVQWLLSEVPFEAFHKVAVTPHIVRHTSRPGQNENDGQGQFDRTQPVVHIWGPVMVLPFTTIDEALGTVQALCQDPGVSEIRAVVVDLRERPIDEGFGAAALEQILEMIESWNAQSLITGVCPAADAAIESLEVSHLVIRKDLPQAIATAFQIADAQKFQL